MTKHTLPGLEHVLELARIEEGRWAPMLDDLNASGVPLNAGQVPVISENWASLLTPGLRKVWSESMATTESTFKRTSIFPVDSSQQRSEKYQGVGDLGTSMWNQYDKAGRVTYDGFQPTWPQELVHRRFAGGVMIEREVMEDNLYPGAPIPKTITQQVSALAQSAAYHREQSAAALFNNAFTDSGLDAEQQAIAGPDAVGLVSTAHPNSPTDATTQSNEFTLALTGDNLTTIKLAMKAFTNDRGKLSPSNPTTLLVPPALEETALIINESTLDPTSANNAINPNKGKWNIVVWDFLTDTNAWFLIDEAKKNNHLIWLDRVLPQFESERDFDTNIGKWKGYYRFSRGWDSWTWIAGSNPS